MSLASPCASSKLDEENHTPTTFHSFRKLPTELRFEIWKIAANVPRTLELLITEIWEQLHDTLSLDCSSRTVAPSILYTNSESREVGLNFYSREIDGRDVRFQHNHDARSKLTVPWINWGKDRIFLRMSDVYIMNHPRLDEFAKMCQANGLRRLVLETGPQDRRSGSFWGSTNSYAKWWFLDELGAFAKNTEELAGCQCWCRGFDLAPLPEGSASFVKRYRSPLRLAWFAMELESAWDEAKRDDPTIERTRPLVQRMAVSSSYSPYCTNNEHNKMAYEWNRLRSYASSCAMTASLF